MARVRWAPPMSDYLSHLPNQFINWAKIDGAKVPVDPLGHKINHLDPANWTTFAGANASDYPVGFVFSGNDPWFFLDFDKCLDKATAQWKPEANMHVKMFPGALIEVSQSGEGLHIIGKCRPEALADRKNRWDGWKEFYTKNRFIAFGPSGWQPIGGEFLPDADHTDALLKVVPQREFDPTQPLPTTRDPMWSGPEDDDELIARMCNATGGALGAFGGKILPRDLWNRDEEKLTQFFPVEDEQRKDGVTFDWSRADSALCFHLAFWTGRDMNRMDRIFRRSGLMRKKWNDRADYRSKTLSNAVRGTRTVYSDTLSSNQDVHLASSKPLTVISASSLATHTPPLRKWLVQC